MKHCPKRMAIAVAFTPFMVACGGGGGDHTAPAAVNVPQCSGASCGTQGVPTSAPLAAAGPLCPADADIGKSTFLGGAGSGEIVRLNIDASAMKYTLTWLESPVPFTTGTVMPTRAGTTITGAVAHPPAGTLPTTEQTRCSFVLLPGGGVSSVTQAKYSTAADFNQANPPMILMGFGVAGGGIPGATVQFDGVSAFLFKVGTLKSRHVDFYPFLGFASTTTDIAKLVGTYNSLSYHAVPTDDYQSSATSATETFDANGVCTSASKVPLGGTASATGCLTTGTAWTANNKGYLDSQQAPQLLSQFQRPLVGASSPRTGVAHMVLGQTGGVTVPLVVRTGMVNSGSAPFYFDSQIDDESGIALLAKTTAVQPGSIDGSYVGADSNFKYTAAVVNGTSNAFVNPGTQQVEDRFTLDYGQATPGLLKVTTIGTVPAAGLLITSAGLYATLINGPANGGMALSSATLGSGPNVSALSSSPYFGIGALIKPQSTSNGANSSK